MPYNTRSSSSSSRVRMDQLSTLTFYADEMTAFRRTEPVAQLTCIGKPCTVYQPDVVQCTAQGGSGIDVQWRCQADLPSSMRFGRVEVSCEGYDSPSDPYVLKGSCGLTYHLVPANPNLEKADYGYGYSGRNRLNEFASKFVGNLFNILTLAVLLYVLWSAVLGPIIRYFSRNAPLVPGSSSSSSGGQGPPRPWFGGFGGGGGGGGSGGWGGGTGGSRPSSDPSSSSSSDTKPSTTSATTSQTSPAWQPGFWTGLAGGALGAMAANSLRGRNEEQQARRRWGYSAPPSAFGGGGGGYRRDRDWDRGEGSSGTSGMRTSSGFGGTRNR